MFIRSESFFNVYYLGILDVLFREYLFYFQFPFYFAVMFVGILHFKQLETLKFTIFRKIITVFSISCYYLPYLWCIEIEKAITT